MRATRASRRTLQYKDLLDAIRSSEQCDFLIDVIHEFNVRAPSSIPPSRSSPSTKRALGAGAVPGQCSRAWPRVQANRICHRQTKDAQRVRALLNSEGAMSGSEDTESDLPGPSCSARGKGAAANNEEEVEEEEEAAADGW